MLLLTLSLMNSQDLFFEFVIEFSFSYSFLLYFESSYAISNVHSGDLFALCPFRDK